MNSETENGLQTSEDDGREITAKLLRDELVRGWRERPECKPRVVPIIRFGAKTDLGRLRENNEDKFDFYEPEDPTLLATRGCFYAVADGMGGHAAGQIASELALKNVMAHYYDNATDSIPIALLEAIAAANETIHNIALMIPERGGMGTTLTAAIVVEDRVYIGQVGDSRAYLIRSGGIRQVTFDHSWVAEQVRLGGLTAEEAEFSPYRNVITRSIGTQPVVEPDVFEETVEVGDIWVLCTDGLTSHVEDEEIRLIASTQAPSEAARQFIELANARGGRDNITVFVLSIRDLVTDPLASGQTMEQESAMKTATPSVVEERRGLRKLWGR